MNRTEAIAALKAVVAGLDDGSANRPTVRQELVRIVEGLGVWSGKNLDKAAAAEPLASLPPPPEVTVEVVPKLFVGRRFTVPYDGKSCFVCQVELSKGEVALGSHALRAAAHLECGQEEPR